MSTRRMLIVFSRPFSVGRNLSDSGEVGGVVTFAVLFPGQGSQFVGMGADVFAARPDLVGDRAGQILGWSLREVCLEGPEERLTRTEYAQPALFAIAHAVWSELEPHLPHPPAAAAGHSLGEYTALVAAGMLDHATALGIVAERGRAMAEASDATDSGMAALIGADVATAERVVSVRSELGGRLSVANDNAPGQVVVAGSVDDLEWLEVHARDLGVRRAIRLKVAGAFHSEFMAMAADRVAAAVAEAMASESRFDAYSNVTARPVRPSEIGSLLVEQVTSRVRFRESLLDMAEAGIDTFVHVGPGDVTAGMASRTVPGAHVIVVSDLAGIPAAAETLSTMSRSRR